MFCFIDDLIYLSESWYPMDGADDGQWDKVACARRVFVLTPEGVTVQVYTLSWEHLQDTYIIDCMGHFDGRLLLFISREGGEEPRMIALDLF